MAFLEMSAMKAPRADANRYRIVSALIGLVEGRSLDQITVSDICHEAGISRQSFYRLFTSKYEIASWFWNKLADEYILQVGFRYTWYEGFYLSFESLSDYLAFFEKVGNASADVPTSYNVAKRIQRIEEAMRDVLKIELTPQLRLELESFSHVEYLVLRGGLERYGFCTPKEKARALTACIPEGLRAAIDNGVLRLRDLGVIDDIQENINY